MKEFKKTPITKERLLSFGFEDGRPFCSYTLQIEGIEDKEFDFHVDMRKDKKGVYYIDLVDYFNTVTLPNIYKTMEDIKQLITGLTGKQF
jgi:hypothetical protein